MKLKIFTNMGDASKLESDINRWLAENGEIDVKHVQQSYACDGQAHFYTLVSVWYDTVRRDVPGL